MLNERIRFKIEIFEESWKQARHKTQGLSELHFSTAKICQNILVLFARFEMVAGWQKVREAGKGLARFPDPLAFGLGNLARKGLLR